VLFGLAHVRVDGVQVVFDALQLLFDKFRVLEKKLIGFLIFLKNFTNFQRFFYSSEVILVKFLFFEPTPLVVHHHKRFYSGLFALQANKNIG
jgi:hypothetical protein